ncbi:MAG: alpha-galactosidase [Phycisphaeraceae bacterium]|nr:alpha-galactosidase [Phycisphaeraceae bacterium]
MPDKVLREITVAHRHLPRLWVEGDPGPFSCDLSLQVLEANLYLIRLVLAAPTPAEPPKLLVRWDRPLMDIIGFWHPLAGSERGVSHRWGPGLRSRNTQGAPVICNYSQHGVNSLTFACSDALNPLQLKASINERTAYYNCRVDLFPEPHAPIRSYELFIRIDLREIPYYQALEDVQKWWAGQPGYAPSPVPDVARRPMYSTWYSFHQNLVEEDVLTQCRLGKHMGCDAIILDDGWQTTNNQGYYHYVGEWEPQRLPKIKQLVEKVHQLDMKFLLWYSVPFVGERTKAFNQFKNQQLYHDQHLGCAVLDPRFPQVRRYLIDTFVHAVRAWNLDGLKLDFVDSFDPSRQVPLQTGQGRDEDSVAVASDRLLTDLMTQLRADRPDIMVEFRQSYIGPLMRKYGNMFRAADCPNDALNNRIRIVDVRLLCGRTAPHADMLMWHVWEPVESAALQLLNVLFAVPQISVRLEHMPAFHARMLQFWLGWWRRHRQLLLDGRFMPQSPELLYPIIQAANEEECVAVIYADMVIRPAHPEANMLLLVNATRRPGLVVDLPVETGRRRLRIYSCMGDLTLDQQVKLPAGLHTLNVPSAGVAELTVE